MQRLEWKARIAILWIITAVSTSAVSILYISHPGNINEAINGKIEGEQVTTGFLMMLAAFWVVPFVLAFLTFVLKDNVNRIVNMVMGLVMAVVWGSDLVTPLVQGKGLEAEHLAIGAAVIAGLLIFWHALRWPRPVALEAPEVREVREAPKVEHREMAHTR